jgi:DNA polymerase-3 subunit alpha
MSANLTSCIGDQDQFLVMKNEAERMGLKILPPDVNSSFDKCSIEGKSIRLGLNAIKNVGKATDSILAARVKKAKFTSIFDLCTSVDTRLVNKKCLESLICAGALDSLTGTRAQLFAAIDMSLDFAGSRQKDRISGQTDLFSMASEDGNSSETKAFEVPEPALPQVAPWPYNELLAKEKSVLNFYISGHPLDNYRDEVNGFSSLHLDGESLLKTADGGSVTVGGVITTVRTHSQKDGRMMAFLVLEDFHGSIELLAFGDAFEKYRHLLALDSMVLVKGNCMKEDEKGPKIRVEKVMALSDSRSQLARSVHLRMRTNGLEEDFVKEVLQQCEEVKGQCALILHMVTKDQNEFKVRSKKVHISPDREVVEKLREKVGRDNVWISRSSW